MVKRETSARVPLTVFTVGIETPTVSVISSLQLLRL